MKLLEILQKELKEFPEGMLYAVQDNDGEVKFGKHSHPTLCESGIWQRREDGIYPNIGRLELAEDWDSAIVTKEMWENDRVKSKMINISQQGHPHAKIMAAYAEDAKTTDKPWELWQFNTTGEWRDLTCNPTFATHLKYRRKPKTHTVNGVEVPDLRIDSNKGGSFYLADPTEPEFTFNYLEATKDNIYDSKWIERGLCYEHTEEGKQAAILHAKSMLGIA